MGKDLFTQQSEIFSQNITKAYSTSFSAALRLINTNKRQDVYNIYGLVRIADELVDTIKAKNSLEILNEFEKDTLRAMKSGASLNPAILAFAQTARKCQIEPSLVVAFFASMRQDINKKSYSQAEYEDYIYGSAEVVGLMCLRVFCDNNSEYIKLKKSAQALGAGFQKVNFLRDIKDDYNNRGRTYFPDIQYKTFSETQKKAIEKDIADDFTKALPAIKKLNTDCKYANLLAYLYYKKLLKKISHQSVEQIKTNRISVNNFYKTMLFVYVRILKLIKI